jgi:hypothetical protein
MPVKVGTASEEGSIIGGYNCIRDYLYRYYDARDRNSATGNDTTWYDISGNNVDMSLQNGISGDHVNYYWDFDGTDDYFSGTFLTLTDDSNFSIEAWIQLGSNNELGGIVTQGYQGNSFGLGRSTNGTVNFTVRGSSSRSSASGVLSTSIWYHLVGTYANTHNTLLYVNGVAQTANTSDPGTVSTTETFYIGHKNATGGSGSSMRYFDGIISIVRVYNKTLSHDEVLYNFNADRGGFGV